MLQLKIGVRLNNTKSRRFLMSHTPPKKTLNVLIICLIQLRYVPTSEIFV